MVYYQNPIIEPDAELVAPGEVISADYSRLIVQYAPQFVEIKNKIQEQVRRGNRKDLDVSILLEEMVPELFNELEKIQANKEHHLTALEIFQIFLEENNNP